MPVSFPCSNCGQVVTAQNEQVGGYAQCPSCGSQQTVPSQPMNPAFAGQAQPGGSPPQQGQPGGYPQQQGQPGGYPPQQGQPGGYPPQQGQPGGYPPQQGQPGGYPPQQGQPGGYPQQQYGYAPVEAQSGGSNILGRIGGIVGFIIILLLINVVTYFGCGMIVY